MSGTTAYDARDFLYRAILALPAAQAAGVTVSKGFAPDPTDHWVYLGNITWASEDWATLGAKKRDETYEIALVINCRVKLGNHDDAETAVRTLLDPIEVMLRTDPRMGGLLWQSGLSPKNFDSQPLPDGGYEAQYVGAVTCEARI